MKIKAINNIIEFDSGQMLVLNPGDIGKLSEAKAQARIDSGDAEAVEELAQLDHDDDGEPGGSIPNDLPALTGKNKAQLLEIADAEGVEVADSTKNADIIAAIEAKRIADALSVLVDESGAPLDLPEGSLSDAPQSLDLTDDERAVLPDLESADEAPAV